MPKHFSVEKTLLSRGVPTIFRICKKSTRISPCRKINSKHVINLNMKHKMIMTTGDTGDGDLRGFLDTTPKVRFVRMSDKLDPVKTTAVCPVTCSQENAKTDPYGRKCLQITYLHRGLARGFKNSQNSTRKQVDLKTGQSTETDALSEKAPGC